MPFSFLRKYIFSIGFFSLLFGIWASNVDIFDLQKRTIHYCILLGFLFTLVVTDIKLYIISDQINIAIGLQGLVFIASTQPNFLYERAIFSVIVYVTLLMFSLGFYSIRKKIGLGQGDVKLLAVITIWVGPMHLLYLLLFSCILGILIILGASSLYKMDPKTVVLPFGPVIAVIFWFDLLFFV